MTTNTQMVAALSANNSEIGDFDLVELSEFDEIPDFDEFSSEIEEEENENQSQQKISKNPKVPVKKSHQPEHSIQQQRPTEIINVQHATSLDHIATSDMETNKGTNSDDDTVSLWAPIIYFFNGRFSSRHN